MEISLSVTIWKYALLALSVFISIVDVALVSYGVEALGCASSIAGAYTVTFIGCLVLTVCFIASFASLRESKQISIAFMALTVLSVLMETIFMIYFAAQKSDYMLSTAARIDALWENGIPREDRFKMENIQAHYYCCGKDSPQDYLENDRDLLPASCCFNENCNVTANIFSHGCHEVIINFFDHQSDNMIITIVGLIFLEALGIAAAYYLCKSIDRATQKGEITDGA